MPHDSAESKLKNLVPLEALVPDVPLLLPRHLAMTATCSNVIPKTSSTITL